MTDLRDIFNFPNKVFIFKLISYNVKGCLIIIVKLLKINLLTNIIKINNFNFNLFQRKRNKIKYVIN